jgi:ketosteroid isomerase-like protein
MLLMGVMALFGCCGCAELAPKQDASSPPTPPPAPEPETKPVKIINPPNHRPSLMEADAAFARAAEDLGTADAFHDYMTADALLLLPGEIPVKGNDAIKVHLQVNPPGIFTFRPRDGQASDEGDLGFTWGTYDCRPQAGEEQISRNRFGKYLSIWKKQADGRWKIQVHSESPNPSPAERR